jgi:thiamine biosynthesis protein ThiI
VTDRTSPANGLHAEPCVLEAYGETGLKAGNQQWFERHVVRDVRHAPADRRDGAPRVRSRHRGGVLVAPATDLSQSGMVARADDVIRDTGTAASTFAAQCRHRDRGLGLTAEQPAARVGARVCAELGWQVYLTRPDSELAVEVGRREIFPGVKRYPVRGGRPVGSSGRALAYRAMHRGPACDFVHCTGVPYSDASSTYKACPLARELAQCQPCSRLFPAAVGRAQRTSATSGAGEAQVVARRRPYMKLADVLVCRVGTRETAAPPYQDCCQLFQPRRVARCTTTGRLAETETGAGLDALVDNVLSHLRELDRDTGEMHDATTVVKDQ